MIDPPLTIGIEEEYLLVEKDSRALARHPPEEMIGECAERVEDLVRPEFLRSQIEVGTRVCRTIEEARSDLSRLRQCVAEVAAKYDLAPIAASTHPFSEWREQEQTDRERYNVLAQNMQGVARRLLICGMHVHVGIDDDELRIDLLNQLVYFLPHLLALSTSSPFWRGQDTGLKSYRLSVFDELPRTGLPARFTSFIEYQRYVDVLVRAGLIEDATVLWWDIRPSARFPTLEMRICDMCTRIDDAIAISALFLCIVRMLCRLRRVNQRWRIYESLLINENRWRAQRYGMDEGLVDFGKGQIVPFTELLEELIELTAEDAAALSCEDEVRHVLEIARRGSSAHQQLSTYNEAVADNLTEEEALKKVVDSLMDETLLNL